MPFPVASVAVMLTAVFWSGENWNPKLAAGYLDARQVAWREFKPAAAPGGTCAACHGGLLYAMARPALRAALGESAAPTEYEKEIVDGLLLRLEKPEGGGMFKDKEEPGLSQGRAVEAILAAYLLPGNERAMRRLIDLQIKQGDDRGAWNWFNFKLEPWEGPESKFYGAALAAMALAGKTQLPDAGRALRDTLDYLARNQASQPLHNRAMLLWNPQLTSKTARKEIAAALLEKQSADGSWTNESIGPWSKTLRAGDDGYATAIAAYSLLRGGVSPAKEPRLAKSLAWLAAHQDASKGNWIAQSMNKQRAPDSMPGQFMNDAATAFAVLALLDPKASTSK